MFLTRLFRHVMEHYPHLDNGIDNVVDRVMRPLALKQTRKPQSDRGMPKARHFVSSSSAHHYGSSSHHYGSSSLWSFISSSRASTPSSTTFLNSLSPLNYQRYDIPTFSQQDNDLLSERQTALLNQTQNMHEEVRGVYHLLHSSSTIITSMASTKASTSKPSKRPKINIIPPKQLFIDLSHEDTKTASLNYQVLSPSTLNAPSKTPSTVATSSSSIDYKPKSPTFSTSPSTNCYLNSPMFPPPRVPPPPPTQESGSIDITLTLLPITPLDIQFNALSLSPPILGHPIP
ncbi:hypothetical protein Tco_1229904 [Tanacetum coccineum]